MTKADLDDALFFAPRLPLAILTAIGLPIVAGYIILEDKMRDWIESAKGGSDVVNKW